MFVFSNVADRAAGASQGRGIRLEGDQLRMDPIIKFIIFYCLQMDKISLRWIHDEGLTAFCRCTEERGED